MKAISLALGLALVVYICVGVLCIYTFGSEVKPSVLDNVGGDKSNAYAVIT